MLRICFSHFENHFIFISFHLFQEDYLEGVKMANGVNFVLVRTVFGAVMGMFYFGFNTGVVNAPEESISLSLSSFTNLLTDKHLCLE